MPYPGDHHKITVYGDSYNGSEQWSFGWRMFLGDLGDAGAQARADALAPVVSAFWTDATAPRFKSTHRLQGIKCAIIQADGTYPDGHIAGEVFFANVPGPAQSGLINDPVPQASVAVTLTTARPRGLASKGRFFLPPMEWILEPTGLMREVDRDGIVTNVHDFLTAVNNAQVGAADIAIFSRGVGVKTFNAETGKIEWTYPNPGRSELVTGIEVGKVVDTQRRRRRSLTESREGVPLG